MIQREIISEVKPHKVYEVGWNFAPASEYAHVTQVWAESEDEAYNNVIDYLQDKADVEIDAWVLRTV